MRCRSTGVCLLLSALCASPATAQDGGGGGGHSIGIAFRGTPQPMDASDFRFDLGEPGLGGVGNGSNGNGTPGAKEPTIDFTSP